VNWNQVKLINVFCFWFSVVKTHSWWVCLHVQASQCKRCLWVVPMKRQPKWFKSTRKLQCWLTSGTKMDMWTTPQQCFQKQLVLFLHPAPAYLCLENSHSVNKLKKVHISSAKKNLVVNWSSLASAVLLYSRRKSLGLTIFAIIQHNGMLNCVNRLDNFQE
jgi:hypothetical protein